MLIDLNFEDEEEVQAPEAESQIALEFEGEEGLEPSAPGVSGEMRSSDRNPFEWIRDAYMEGYSQTRKNIAQQKGLMFDETKEDTARTGARIKELERTAEGYGPELDTMQQLYEISEADSIADAVGLMVKYPEATAQVTLSSLGRFAPALAVTAGVSTVTGGAAIPFMGSTFMGSLSIEYGAVMDETISESGYDSTDPRAWEKAVSDQTMLDRAKERGIKRGIPIAVFDAISAGLAGKILAGAKPTVTSILTRSTGEMAQQSVAGGLGEAAAQIVDTGGIEKPGEIALEGFAEIGPGMVETLIGYKGSKQQALRKLMAEQAGYEASQNVADAAITPDFEIHTLDENVTAIDEALAATPPTPEARPDEESATERFDLEEQPIKPEPLLDLEQQQAEDEANVYVLDQLRAQFPDASEAELQAAITTARPKPEELPTEEDLGFIPAEAETDTEMDLELDETALDEITRDEVVAATENVESTGEAIDTAEEWRTSRPEFAGTIFSFKPGDDRGTGAEIEPMEHYYGEIAGTEDADNMPVDVMLNNDYDAAADTPIFIIDQMDADSQEFWQHKVMAGFDEMAEAEQAYINQWGEEGLQNTSELTADEFKEWISTGDHKVAYGETIPAGESLPATEEVAPDDTVDDDDRSWGPQGAPEGMETKPTETNPREWVRARKTMTDEYPGWPSILAQQDALQAEAAGLTPDQWMKQTREGPPDTDIYKVGYESPKESELTPEEQKAQDKADRNEDQRVKQTEKTRSNLMTAEDDDVVTFVRKLGGINMTSQSDIPAGRLNHLNEDNRMIGLAGIEQTGERGLTLSKITENLWEAGFIPANDETLAINLLYEAENGPQYTAKGHEMRGPAEQEAWDKRVQEEYEEQLNQDADDMAAYMIEQSGGPRFSSEDLPELIAMAADEDYGAVIDITGDSTLSEDEVRTKLQAIIDGEEIQQAEDAADTTIEGTEEVSGSAPGVPSITSEAELETEEDSSLVRGVPISPRMEEAIAIVGRDGFIGRVTRSGNRLHAAKGTSHMERIAEGMANQVISENWHGSPKPNKNGVFVEDDIENVEKMVFEGPKSSRASVELDVVRIAENLWAPGYSIRSRTAGSGSGMSFYDAFDTKEEAQLYNLNITKQFFEKEVSENQPKTTQADAKGALKWVNEQIDAISPTEEVAEVAEVAAPKKKKTTKKLPNIDEMSKEQLEEELGYGPTMQDADYLRKLLERKRAETGQTDLVGKTGDEVAQQAILDAKAEKAEKIPTERPAEAQSGDDLFAAGGQLEPDLFDEPAPAPEFKKGDRVVRLLGGRPEPSMAGEVTEIDGPFVFVRFDEDPTDNKPIPKISLVLEPEPEAKPEPKTKGEQSNSLVENITASDYPVGTEYIWGGFRAKVTGIQTREETGGRPRVNLEILEGPRKGATATAPGHLKNLQADLIPPFDIETTMGTVRLDVGWTMGLERYQEIYEEKTVGILNIQMHGPDDRNGSMRYRSIAGMPVRAETPEQLLDPEWIKDVAITAADSVLRKGEYFGEHVNMGKYKGGKAKVVGRPITSMTEVLELSRDPTPDAKDLTKITIAVKTDDATVSHKAKWWIDALDKRLEAVAKLRTCA